MPLLLLQLSSLTLIARRVAPRHVRSLRSTAWLGTGAIRGAPLVMSQAAEKRRMTVADATAADWERVVTVLQPFVKDGRMDRLQRVVSSRRAGLHLVVRAGCAGSNHGPAASTHGFVPIRTAGERTRSAQRGGRAADGRRARSAAHTFSQDLAQGCQDHESFSYQSRRSQGRGPRSCKGTRKHDGYGANEPAYHKSLQSRWIVGEDRERRSICPTSSEEVLVTCILCE